MTAAVRHGTTAGYRAGCRCEPCRWAIARYEKQRVLDRARGLPRMVDSTIAQRQLEGLMALGWPSRWIANELIPGARTIEPLTPMIRRERAERIDALARRVGDAWGPSEKARRYAARHGWRVPAWWDENWQDPGPCPSFSERREQQRERLERVARLTRQGFSASEIAVRLGISERQVQRDRGCGTPETSQRHVQRAS